MSICHHPHVNPDRGAPGCDDQLPLISRVGRGIHGDGYKVEIDDPDSASETHLHGYEVDGATGEVTSDWVSENINGGELSYQYNLRPFTIPQTFTITFIYRRPGRPEWTWTTPAIPYVWSIDEDGNKDQGDGIVGSGVATLFIKKTTEATWKEMLLYPEGTKREDFNAPEAEEPWTVNLSFGVGGDIDVPNIDDIAKILGITVEDIRKIIAGNQVTINGVDVRNIIEYIDKQDDNHQKATLDHVHKDLGFNETGHPDSGAFGGQDTVKEYIDAAVKGTKDDLDGQVDNLTTYVKNALGDILNKIYGGGTLGADGHVTWPNANKVPVADLNVFTNNASPTNSTFTDAIRSRALSDDDLRGA